MQNQVPTRLPLEETFVKDFIERFSKFKEFGDFLEICIYFSKQKKKDVGDLSDSGCDFLKPY